MPAWNATATCPGCALSGTRLLTHQKRQRAAAGTPDPGTDDGGTDCNIGGLRVLLNIGARAKCASNWGAFDMVGNPELNLEPLKLRH